jgi:DnaK suppressor protein
MSKRAAMDAKTRAEFRRTLLRKRQSLFNEVEKLETDLRYIAEDREPELEESAQEERSARLLARLDDRGVAALEAIERALARVEVGEYGLCTECGQPIPAARLEAVPETPYCRDCADKAEQREGSGAEGPETPATASSAAAVPPDYSLLSEPELERAIREHLREDRRVDMEELRIVCRHGVVHLSGSVPSEGEHQIVLQTVTDVMGLKDVDDRLQAKEILWEREDRNGQEGASETAPWEELAGTEDITETHEDGTDFVPPVRPMPEEQ